MRSPIQPEPFLLRNLGDGVSKSLVIPLPRGRALRVGFRLDAWCKLGPRRYKVIVDGRVIDDLEDLFERCGDPRPREEIERDFREKGVHIQGDLRATE